MAFSFWGNTPRFSRRSSDKGFRTSAMPSRSSFGGHRFAFEALECRVMLSGDGLDSTDDGALPADTLDTTSEAAVLNATDSDVLTIDAPTGRAVFQRDDQNQADVTVAGDVASSLVTQIEARAVVIDGYSGTSTEWCVIDAIIDDGEFLGTLEIEGGWYTIEVRAYAGSTLVDETSVAQVGVGEVFVTVGQSNAANWGSTALVPEDERVSAYGPEGWQLAADPQPGADGMGGSPWPALGDLLVDEYDVPVGFISLARGGKRVDQWLPGTSLYETLQTTLEELGPGGCRAVLWHQGEADNYAGTSADDYAAQLTTLIEQSRIDAGWQVPWGVAVAGYYPYGTAEGQAAVVTGQQQVIDSLPDVFQGATTDDLVGDDWRLDGIHFNEAGLREHAARWAESIVDFVGSDLVTISDDGSQVTVHGTDGDDCVTVAIATDLQIMVNGVTYRFDTVTQLSLDLGDGCDTVSIVSSTGDDWACFGPHQGVMVASGVTVTVANVETLRLDAGAGDDVVKLYDSPGDDLLVACPGFALLEGEGFSIEVVGFESVLAYATAGGLDAAKLYDSPGDDLFYASPIEAILFGEEFYSRTKFFEANIAYATAGGIDGAKLIDSADDDVFYGDPKQAALYGSGFYNRAKFFEGVNAYALYGGHDVAQLYDSEGDDRLYGSSVQAALFGTGFYNRAKYFEEVHARASSGGDDVAELYDSVAEDLLEIEVDQVSLSSDTLGFVLNAEHFAKVLATVSDETDRIEGGEGTLDFELELIGPWPE